MAGLPDFVVQGPPRDDPQMPPPYGFDQVLTRFFIVNADGAKLGDFCDRCFNDIPGAPLRIEPLIDLVYIQILTYPRMYSSRPGYPELGFVTQNELVFAIPVIVTGGLLPRLGVVIPFLFVDDDHSLITGRDVIGYPKCYAEFQMPDSEDGVGLRVDASAPSAPRNSNTPWKNQALLELASGVTSPWSTLIAGLDRTQARRLWPWGPPELYDPDPSHHSIDAPFYPIDAPLHRMMRTSAGISLPTHTLKQFRDAGQPMKACYQAIVRSRMVVLRFRGFGPLDARIHLHRYPGLDIADRLGVGQTIDPVLGFWYRADLALTDVENVFVRCADSGPEVPRGNDCGVVMGNMVRTTLRCYAKMGRIWLDCLEELTRDN